MKDQLLLYVKENWKKFNLDHRPKKINFYVKNRYRKMTFFLFGKGKPFALAKYTPYPRDRNEIVKEYKILRSVEPNLKSFPKTNLTNIGGYPVMFQEFIPWKQMEINGLFKMRKMKENFEKATRWLIDFNKGLKKDIIHDKIIDFIQNPIKQAMKSDKEFREKDFTWMTDKAKQLNEVYLIPKHTDFWSENILVNKEKLVVLDWEDFGLIKTPLFDIFHFIVSYMLVMNHFYVGEDHCDKFLAVFFRKTKYTSIIKGSIEKYCDALDIDKEFIDLYFALYLLEFYNLRYKQEGPAYDITIRTNKFIKIFLKNRSKFILRS